jgi:Leucine-rich repeat (LRR) protein
MRSDPQEPLEVRPPFERVRLAVLFVALTLALAPSGNAAIPASERQALVDLYNSTNGAAWSNRGNWLGAPGTECTWFGVTCDSGQTTVNLLSLNGNNLAGGPLPSSIGSLTQLQMLALANNRITGSIPSQIGNLTQLRSIYLDNNQLSGSIPAQMGSLTQLTDLFMANNQLSGTLPGQFGSLTQLRNLYLSNNQLSGGIPVEIGSMAELRNLFLNDNRFSGSIPAQLGNLTNLSNLYLFSNQLSGPLPTQLGNLTQLAEIILYNNQLSGSIPSQLGNLTQLRKLYLINNQLSGSIPAELGLLTQMTELYLNDNQLSGSIPAELGSLTQLTDLFLSHNQLSGGIPAQIGSLTRLGKLYLNGNQLSGPVPPELSGLSSLFSLEIAYNALFSNSPALTAFLNSKQSGWQNTQTIAPSISAGGATTTSITLTWSPIPYTGDSGFYQAYYSATSGGPYTPFPSTTPNKSSSSLSVTGLAPNTPYYFVVSTTTLPNGANQNTVRSGFSAEVSAATNTSCGGFGSGTVGISASPGATVSVGTTIIFAPLFSNYTEQACDSYSWNFGDGSASTTRSPAHVFNSSGSYAVVLNVRHPDGSSISGSVNVTVAPPPPPTATISVTPSTITAGQSATLTWSTSNATTFSIDNYNGLMSESGSAVVQPATTTTYILRATGAGGTATAQATLTVKPAVPLRIVSFTAAPQRIRLNEAATLTWTTEGATAVVIDNALGAQPFTGSITVTPKSTTTYTLTAMQGSTASTQSVTVEVLTLPVIDVTSLPSPIVQVQGSGGATTTYALTNSGGAPSSLTLSQNGSFFTQSPSSFNLAPGATQIITITGIPSAAGALEGTSIPAGAGVPSNLQVPVRLLSAAPPAGAVTAVSDTTRVDVAAPVAVNPTGSVMFTNSGSAPLSGVLSADVPWIIPQSGVITIAVGTTATLTFTVDRSKRPVSSALVGSAQGNLTLSFLTAQPLSKGALDSPPSNVSVQLVRVVDTVQPAAGPGSVPPLAPGEVAVFVPGVGHFSRVSQGSRLQFLSDVSLLNPQGSRSLDDVKLFYTPLSGNSAAAQTTTVPPTAANVSVALADAARNIFGVNEQIGTLHVRSRDAARLAIAATSVAPGNPAGALGTDLPVLRSDRAAAAGEIVALTGLRKDASAHSDLYIQETSGSSATVRTEFISANGIPVGSPQTATIEPFKLLEMPDVVPSGAVSAILTNTSSNGAKVLAYASLVDEQSKDTWVISDWSRQLGYAPGETVVIPIAGSLRGANDTNYRSDLAIMNRGTAAAAGTIRYTTRNGLSASRQITLAARETAVLQDVASTLFNVNNDIGYMTFTPVTGSFAITSRTFATSAGQSGAFSSSVPVVAQSSAMAKGNSLTIASLEDADRRTLSPTRPGTFRTNVALMETSGRSVTVRITLRYTFPAGLSAKGVGSTEPRDYVLAPNSFILLRSIADELLASHRLREVVGDLKRIEAEFQVVAGDGQVVIVTSSADNRSGDSIIRTQ